MTTGTWNPGFTEPLGPLHSETTTLAPGDAAMPISGGQSSIAG